MRPNRLVLPLAVLLGLALAAPAAQASFDWNTDVVSFDFQPPAHKIAVGDSVTWSFVDAGHTSTSLGGQPDSWDSRDEGAGDAGTTFTHVFDIPGRYQYVCIPHRSFMKGTIVVGTDTVAKTVSRFRTHRRGSRVKISFVLNEPATVRYRLRGPSPRRVKKGRLLEGPHSFSVRHLERGSYHGALTAVDDFDHKVTLRNAFVIR